MKLFFSFTLFLFLSISCLAYSQSTTSTNKLSHDLIHFFSGDWSGQGEFANGKKISADLSFKITLDSAWLSYEHSDKLPGTYKASSMWGVDALTGQFLAYSFDNFQGHRNG